jgi:hypothetical protein
MLQRTPHIFMKYDNSPSATGWGCAGCFVSSVFTRSTPLEMGAVGVVGVIAEGVAGAAVAPGTVPAVAAAAGDIWGLLQQTHVSVLSPAEH